MKEFIAKFGDQISGVLSGFDRLVFRGHLRGISYVTGMKQYLWSNQVLNKEFGAHAEKVTERLKEASLAEAGKLQRPVKYLASSKTSKEDVARSIAAKEGITSGPVCVLTSVEPCWSFEIYRNRETKKLDVVKRERHCLFLYHYWMHPVFGFMNARIQITLIGSLRHLRPAMQIRYPPAHRTPCQRTTRISFLRAIRANIFHVVDGTLRP